MTYRPHYGPCPSSAEADRRQITVGLPRDIYDELNIEAAKQNKARGELAREMIVASLRKDAPS